MNQAQVKTRIFILQSIDWVVLLTVLGFGAYYLIYTDHKFLMAVLILGALFVVHVIGNYTSERIAKMRVDLEIYRRNQLRKL